METIGRVELLQSYGYVLLREWGLGSSFRVQDLRRGLGSFKQSEAKEALSMQTTLALSPVSGRAAGGLRCFPPSG